MDILVTSVVFLLVVAGVTAVAALGFIIWVSSLKNWN